MNPVSHITLPAISAGFGGLFRATPSSAQTIVGRPPALNQKDLKTALAYNPAFAGMCRSKCADDGPFAKTTLPAAPGPGLCPGRKRFGESFQFQRFRVQGPKSGAKNAKDAKNLKPGLGETDPSFRKPEPLKHET
jgi:hypothetical protein